ncbi:non-specific lipid-transfer protein 2 [Phtheirospermum japonicum]|uniref:Non-specific lipid-transfer protein n=1 Tax=Phtheirospermum japonicum TaxID=374723 RepID=A0A830DPZ0_9LAMI|nr:non-specific lipid-transfer protein 2 [Phtheirospermum japonicum]
MMKAMCSILISAMLVMAAVPHGEAIGCGTVVSYLNPCIPYLTGKGPIGSCCSGVKSLNSAAKTTPDRQSVCSCLKSIAGSYSVNLGKASGLPGQCGVSIPYKISPSTDCSKYVNI